MIRLLIDDLLSGVIKLKFGSREQIEAIKNYEKAQEEAKEGLKMYRVIFHYTGSLEICINAFDEHEAEEMAKDEVINNNIEWEDLEHTEVELIREINEN